MKERLRTVGIVAQAVLVTSAVWVVIFYLFGDRLPTAPLVDRLAQGGESTKPEARAAVPDGERVRVPASPERPRIAASGLVVPVAGVSSGELVDSYIDDRGGGTRTHEAIDILADTGTPVVAAAPGTVEKLFLSDQGGNTVYIRTRDRRTIYYYAHLDAYAVGLADGQKVRAGDQLGTVGSSGNADPAASHLHFAILKVTPQMGWNEGTPINPYPLLSR